MSTGPPANTNLHATDKRETVTSLFSARPVHKGLHLALTHNCPCLEPQRLRQVIEWSGEVSLMYL